MKAEITFCETGDRRDLKDGDEEEYEDFGKGFDGYRYLQLETFFNLLRMGKFGSDVTVSFNVSTEKREKKGKVAVKISCVSRVVYSVVANKAPEDALINGIKDQTQWSGSAYIY